MAQRDNHSDTAQVHVAGTFKKHLMDNYDRGKVQEYVKTMLEDEGILHGTVILLDSGEEKVTVQVRLHKATISKTAADKVAEIYEAMAGHIETWFLTESAMYHPEIYK